MAYIFTVGLLCALLVVTDILIHGAHSTTTTLLKTPTPLASTVAAMQWLLYSGTIDAIMQHNILLTIH